MSEQKTIALVSCVSKKRTHSSKASALYISDLFLKSSEYARRNSNKWYILSAKYGLVSPDAVIAPYDETLNRMKAIERRTCAEKVRDDFRKVVSPGDTVIFLAGMKYRENLTEPVARFGCQLEIQLEGMRIGEQISWLNKSDKR